MSGMNSWACYAVEVVSGIGPNQKFHNFLLGDKCVVLEFFPLSIPEVTRGMQGVAIAGQREELDRNSTIAGPVDFSQKHIAGGASGDKTGPPVGEILFRVEE